MAPSKSVVKMPGVASGKALAGIPVGDESAEDRVLALLGGSVAEDTYQVNYFLQLVSDCVFLYLSLELRYFLPPNLLQRVQEEQEFGALGILTLRTVLRVNFQSASLTCFRS